MLNFEFNKNTLLEDSVRLGVYGYSIKDDETKIFE